MRMKRLLLSILFVSGLMGFSLFAQTTYTVQVSNYTFSPSTVNATTIDTIKFVWAAGTHPVVSDNGNWTTFSMDGTTYTTYKLYNLAAGSYPFHCQYHGGSGGSGMSGTLTISQASVASTFGKADSYELSTSPNPFEDEINITINPGNKNLTAIRICDLIGKEVAFIDLTHKNGVTSYSVNFENLKPGVYFCNVYSSKGIIETRKLFRTK